MASANTLRVIDSAAKMGPRTHSMPNEPGTRESVYTFPDWQTAIDVPIHHAMQFAQAPDFEVYDQDGKPLTMRNLDGVGGTGKLVLRPDETIARLDELSREALVDRAKRLPGGDKIARMKREDMIDALLAAQKPDMRVEAEDEDDLVESEPDNEDF
jgi:hypothetical protein